MRLVMRTTNLQMLFAVLGSTLLASPVPQAVLAAPCVASNIERTPTLTPTVINTGTSFTYSVPVLNQFVCGNGDGNIGCAICVFAQTNISTGDMPGPFIPDSQSPPTSIGATNCNSRNTMLSTVTITNLQHNSIYQVVLSSKQSTDASPYNNTKDGYTSNSDFIVEIDG